MPPVTLKMVEDLRDTVQDILVSYEARIRELSNKLKGKGVQLLDHSKNERALLTQQLESLLAKKAHLRKKDFRLMMQDIESYQMEHEKRVRQLIEGLSEEEWRRIQSLKKSLDQGGLSKAIEAMTNPGKEWLVKEELAEFQREKEGLSLQLKRILEKADSLSIKDFKKALKRLKAKKREAKSKEQVEGILLEHHKFQKEVRKLLNNFKVLQCSIEKFWQKEMSKIKGGELR